MKSGSTADVLTVGAAGGSAVADGSNSRRVKASIAKAAGCTGAAGALGAVVAVAALTSDWEGAPAPRFRTTASGFFGFGPMSAGPVEEVEVVAVSLGCFGGCRRGLGASLVADDSPFLADG